MRELAFPISYITRDQYGAEYPEYNLGISQRLYIATQLVAGGMGGIEPDKIELAVKNCYILTDELIKQDKENEKNNFTKEK